MIWVTMHLNWSLFNAKINKRFPKQYKEIMSILDSCEINKETLDEEEE